MDIQAAPFTMITLAVTVLVTVAAFSREALLSRLLFSVDGVMNHGEVWRLFTTSLVHANWPHLLFNAFSLLSFGVFLETIIGTWQFAMLYIVGVVVASSTSLVLNRRRWDYRAVGASGGVCAVIGAATALFPEMGMYVFFIPIAIPAWIFGSLFIAYSIVGSRDQWGNVGHSAHLGGEVFGIVFAALFFSDTVLHHWWYVVIMLGSGVAAWVFARSKGLVS